MVQIDTVRPASTNVAGTWTAVGAASLWQATSDNSDASYAQNATSGIANFMSLTTSSHTPAAGHERHRIRGRVRGATASDSARLAWAAEELFGPIPQASSQDERVLTPTINNFEGPWALSNVATAAGAYNFTAWKVSGAGTLRAHELYVDIDTRVPPSFTAEVQDGAGVNRDGGIVSDTSRPVFVFDAADYDGLVARSWTLEVRTVPGGVVVFTASGTGTPPNVQSDPLPNGDYEADLQIFSTIRTNSAYGSTVENVTFEVAFVAPAGPVLTLTPIASPPSIEIDWVSDTATATTWDVNADVVTEIRRIDCNGTSTIYVERTGITAAEHIDRFMSLSYNGVFCDEEDHVCQVCYEARYWGEVDDVLVATDWSTPVCDDVANPTVGNAWMRGADSGDISICPTETFDHVRPFGVFQPIGGGIPTVVTGTPGGRDYTLDFAVTSEADLVLVESILAQPLFFYQPVEQADIWLAPANQNMTVVKVKRIRTVNVPCVAVNPQPVTDPASLF